MKLEDYLNSVQFTQLTLGEIINRVEAIPKERHDGKEKCVYFDFEYLHPHGIHSWRGDYSELTLGFKEEGEAPTVSQFLKMLKDAVGKRFEGYKGGSYKMSRETPVWVANPRNAGNTIITEVVDNDFSIILMTGHKEW